jgi:hypothetical protein
MQRLKHVKHDAKRHTKPLGYVKHKAKGHFLPLVLLSTMLKDKPSNAKWQAKPSECKTQWQEAGKNLGQVKHNTN